MGTESIELGVRDETTVAETGTSTPRYSETDNASNQNLISLEPVDGGFSAWSFVSLCFGMQRCTQYESCYLARSCLPH